MMPMPIVEDLTKTFRNIAMLAKVLRNGHNIRSGHAQVSVQTGHADCIRQLPSHQTRSRRMANRLLTISSVEKDALSC